MKKLANIDRADQSGNAPGMLRLRLFHARDVLGLADPKLMLSSGNGVILPAGGISLAPGTLVVDVEIPSGVRLTYSETMQSAGRSKRWLQTITLSIAVGSADRLDAAQVLAGGRWLAVVMDANERYRLVGRPEQPLLCMGLGADSTNVGLKLEGLTLSPAFFIDDLSTAALLGEISDFSYDFSLDFNA
jgi:hypothetical protein